MKKYEVFKNESDTCVIIVHVYNNCDLASVQKEFIENGYIVEKLCQIGNDVLLLMREQSMSKEELENDNTR